MNILSKPLFNKRGQATTEVTLLLPLLFILGFLIMKIFGLLVVVQKAEIASFYAAKRWELESHRAQTFQDWDKNVLLPSIEKKVQDYIGFSSDSTRKFLSLRKVTVKVERTDVWNIVTLTVQTAPVNVPLLCMYDKNVVCKHPYGDACMRGYNFVCSSKGGGIAPSIVVEKQVPNRDRPISFVLPMSKAK